MSDAQAILADALHAAGFEGIERDGSTLYARSADALEFQAVVDGIYRLTIRYAVRASEDQRNAWMRANPKGRLDIAAGETELSLALPLDADLAAALADWRALVHAGAVAAIEWRRGQRPVHGM